MKKLLSLFLAACMLACLLTGCGIKKAHIDPDVETVVFTDSAGRSVEVPADITRVAPSGAVATMFLASVCPEYMVCISSTPSRSQYEYLDKGLLTLPTTGQLYGSKSTINLESLLSAQPQVIIDLGDAKDGISRDMNSLQNQTNLPVVFIEADLPHMAEAFRMLGQLISSRADRCEELASYVEETVSLASERSAMIPEQERVSVMYTTGVSGLNTNALGSTQAQVIDLIGADNAIVVDDVSNKGGGNAINMEQLYNFDPDVILFTTGSMYGTAADDPAWSQLRAVKTGAYYEIPGLPYNWMSSPPSMNMLLGVRWLGNLLYPEYYDYDMAEEAMRAYRLLWNYELTREQAEAMLLNSTGKRGTP
ncbi:MAG: ABC transporter substrate-binding protein [Oscillospiraceae bacterium]|nr:ABC transporter substrate-binding protein [Oscillospiraceae bacterium]